MSRGSKVGILLVAALAPLVGCDEINDRIDKAAERAADKVVEKKLEESRAQLSDLKSEVENLKSDLKKKDVGINVLKLRFEQLRSSAAIIETDESSGYGTAQTQHGLFYVAAKGVIPYLDGYKLKLQIGNPTTVTFKGATLDVHWGLPFDAMTDENFEDWQKSQQDKSISVLKEFLPGAYTEIEIALTPAKPETVKIVQVGLKFDRMSLRATAK